MLTANQLRQVAGRTGARDIGNVEIDVILTYLLQLFVEKDITAHLAFKGGTMLRKMVFGPRGRLSTLALFRSRDDRRCQTRRDRRGAILRGCQGPEAVVTRHAVGPQHRGAGDRIRCDLDRPATSRA
jgi:predicted nucleotidyltransferase component of viral defense system